MQGPGLACICSQNFSCTPWLVGLSEAGESGILISRWEELKLVWLAEKVGNKRNTRLSFEKISHSRQGPAAFVFSMFPGPEHGQKAETLKHLMRGWFYSIPCKSWPGKGRGFKGNPTDEISSSKQVELLWLRTDSSHVRPRLTAGQITSLGRPRLFIWEAGSRDHWNIKGTSKDGVNAITQVCMGAT